MRFLVRRLLVAVGQVLLVTLLAYLLFFVISDITGASPAQRIAGHAASPAQIARVAHLLGTDKPIYVQYVDFLGHVIRGNFGYSFLQRRPVTEIILPAAGVSMSLILVAVVMWILMAVPIGLVGALRPRSFWDRLLAVWAQVAIATPVFWLAPMLSYVLAFEPSQGNFLGISLGTSVSIFPIEGWVSLTSDPWQWLHHLLLPAFALALGFTGFYARFVRALVMEQLDEDYVRTARSKGARRLRVLRAHVGRVVAPSIITLLGLDLGAAIGGVLFVELVFGLPGLGFVAVNSIQNLDYPVTVGVVTFTGLLTVAAMTLSDLAVAALDPRVRRPVQ
ncbi:MAG: ABC transporter permease [Solirubrobacteraceae bacterium]